MAIIYDFQTNYQAKILEAKGLIDKRYIDQAICLLEEFLTNIKDKRIKAEVKKELLTCYVLKREFETCEEIISEINGLNGLDLVVAAHDILVAMFELQSTIAEQKQTEYCQRLGLTALTTKNLIELVYQLKNFYEAYWFEEVERKVKALKTKSDFESQLSILSDLQEVETDSLKWFENDFVDFFNQTPNPIIKTVVYELLVEKQMMVTLRFESMGQVKEVETSEKQLEEFYQKINEAIKCLQQVNLDEVKFQFLKQQLILFYQFTFPFLESLDSVEVIKELSKAFLQQELDLSSEVELQRSSETTENDITCKMSQYILSLSSLM